MKQIIDCAYCDGQAHLQKAERDLIYRKETYRVVEHFYKCKKCREEFTTTESDTLSFLQAQNQYREQFSIPFPDEIAEIRDIYKLNAKKMSEVLGLGVNGYSNYEKGEIPTPAIGNLISTAGRPEVFKTMLEKAEHYFSHGTYVSTLERVNCLISNEKHSQPFYAKLNQCSEPNSATGFKKTNKDKIANILVAYIRNCKVEYNDRLKLNKLLFYTDFVYYKQYGSSITGLSYRAIDFGPAPTFYDNIFTYFQNENVIQSNWIKDCNGTAKETFLTEAEFDEELFTAEEQGVINTIIEKFKETSSWDLVDLSHKEQGWKKLHREKGIIDYQEFAFDLIGV